MAMFMAQDGAMHFPLRPAALERLMDDHAVLARRTASAAVAEMHRELEGLYRERLIATLHALAT